MKINAIKASKLANKLKSEIKFGSPRVDPALLNPNLPESIRVSEDEIQAYVKKIEESFSEKNINDLIDDCRNRSINAIIVPLGLGKIVALYDKVGGNVDTIHNVRQGIWASEEEKKKYENREVYDSRKYHSHPAYIKANKEFSEQRENGDLKDVYTGEILDERYDLDHTISAKEIDDDPGRVLAELNGEDLANTKKNLNPTSPGTNRSKKSLSMSEYLEKVSERKTAIQKEIDNLKNKEDLSTAQKEELARLEKRREELDALDTELMEETDKNARDEYNSTINKAYYTSKKFAVNVGKESAKTGLRMGVQQAVGLLCYELFNAFVDEVIDIWNNGLVHPDSGSWMKSVMERLKRIGEKIIGQWRKLLASFRDGFLGGLFSELLTVFINAFMTTFKEMIRMIREGVQVLVRTVKSIIFADEDKSLRETLDDALKIFVDGAIAVGGIALDIQLNAFFTALPFKETLIPIFTGLVTGVSIALAMYALDKLDPFGVKDKKRQDAFYAQLRLDEQELLEFQKDMGKFVADLP